MHVELLETMGDDKMVANVARVSYAKWKSGKLDEKDEKLIKFLWEHEHTSPFRHPHLQFRVSCPIYVERQLFKHTVGITVNSKSGRYVDFSDRLDTLKQLRYQSKDSKQGSDGDLDAGLNAIFVAEIERVAAECQVLYKRMCDAGVAKEQARTVLPLSLETEFIWTGSLHAFMHMCRLRLKKDAQRETRDVVAAMVREVWRIRKFDCSLSQLFEQEPDLLLAIPR